jgi:hypothetical protein
VPCVGGGKVELPSERVDAFTASLQAAAARTAVDAVIAAFAEQFIVAAAAVQRVVARPAAQYVVAGAADQDVAAGAAREDVPVREFAFVFRWIRALDVVAAVPALTVADWYWRGESST